MTLELRIERADVVSYDGVLMLEIKYAGFEEPVVLDSEVYKWHWRSKGKLVVLFGEVAEAIGMVKFKLDRHTSEMEFLGLTDHKPTAKLVREYIMAMEDGTLRARRVF